MLEGKRILLIVGGGIGGIEFDVGRRHGLVQDRYATGHGAGMPVFELAPGDKNKGILGIRRFIRRGDFGRAETRSSLRPWKSIPKNQGLHILLIYYDGNRVCGYIRNIICPDGPEGTDGLVRSTLHQY